MNGLMQPGPTLYEAEQLHKKKGSRGLLGEIGEPLSYAPGPVGLLGNALLSAQYATGEKPMDEGLSALAMLTGLMQGTKVAPIMRNAIKVYHGSPHKFDKASSEHIGKGEGAQAYGHGLYWAETPDVARTYKAAGKAAYQNNRVSEVAYRALDASGGDKKKALDFLHKRYQEAPKEFKQLYADAMNNFDAVTEGGGNLYEASLRWPDAAREAADPLSAKHFLDWDKPLSEQPESVRQALRKGGYTGKKWAVDFYNGTGPDATGGRFIYDKPAELRADVLAARKAGEPPRVYKFQGNYDPTTGADIGGNVRDAETLRKLGIPGITYLDGMSRAAGEGTRNYVTFDDALVELLKRNGVGLLGK
jgi:hypothetical protein